VLTPGPEFGEYGYKLLARIGGEETIGPILGDVQASTRAAAWSGSQEIVNIAAIAVVDAQETSAINGGGKEGERRGGRMGRKLQVQTLHLS